MEFLQEYGLFLAKTVTLLLALGIAALLIAAASGRGRHLARERLEVQRLNDRYQAMELALQRQLLSGKPLRQMLKLKRREHKGGTAADKRRVFVLSFLGDIRATQAESLRQEVSAILTVARPNDEVVVRLETGGGTIHGYGLAASQLARLRERGIPVTVTIDRIAASGGYLMACVGNRILAAPFAIVGSIGVVGQMPNFNRLLKRHDIDYELLTAGEYKRTLTMLGENTDAARAKFKQDLEEIHQHFKGFIQRFRPALNIEQVATGEYWLGERALELGLVDELKTSDDYLLEASKEAIVLAVTFRHREPLRRRLTLAFETALQRLLQGRGGYD